MSGTRPPELRPQVHHGPAHARGPPTDSTSPKRERPGGSPVSQPIGASCANQIHTRTRSVAGLRTDPRAMASVCAPQAAGLSVIASVHIHGAGDDFQPHLAIRAAACPSLSRASSCASRLRNHLLSGALAVSRRAIAAALALREISPAERLVAFSLASFANRDQLAWPSNPVAIGRASLSRSQYLHARDRLTDGGLISIAERGGGRGRSTTIRLDFALAGPWWDGPVNPQLVEAVLSRSSARGPARQLLAAIAAMADADQQLSGVTTDELRLAAGLADSTYRRARAALISSGGGVLQGAGRGPRQDQSLAHKPTVSHRECRDRTSSAPRRASSRVTAAAVHDFRIGCLKGRPVTKRGRGCGLGGSVASQAAIVPFLPTHHTAPTRTVHVRPALASEMGAQARTVSSSKGPDVSGDSLKKGAQTRTVSVLNGPDVSGVSLENPAQTQTVSGRPPAQTPPEPRHPTRARGRNPRTKEHLTPLTPLKGGTRSRTPFSSKRPT